MVKELFYTYDAKEGGKVANGTHFTQKTIQATGQDLKRVLGEPTFVGSEDDKVRMEWILEYNAYDNLDNEISATITIYDWKTNPSFNLDDNLYDWHIGSKNFAPSTIEYFIDDLERSITG